MKKDCTDYMKQAHEELRHKREHYDFFEYFALVLEKAVELRKDDVQREQENQQPLTLI